MPHWIINIIQRIVSIPFRILLFIFGSFKVSGYGSLSGVDASKGIILASNHSNQIDSVILGCAPPLFSKLSPVYFVSLDKSHYKRFPIGRFFYGSFIFTMLGSFSIERGLRNYEATLAKHIKLLKQGRTVTIYPEGRMTPGMNLGEARGGVAYLAKVTGAPIIPVCITGEENLRWWQFFLGRSTLKLTYGHPIYFSYIDEPH
ncbi:MAG TPA: lysophospholipid acyltransferase family protein, partial [Candidatus Paceibacterota bacterium]